MTGPSNEAARLAGCPHAYLEFLKTPEAARAEPWQLRELAKMRFGRTPRVGTYKALCAAMQGLEPCHAPSGR